MVDKKLMINLGEGYYKSQIERLVSDLFFKDKQLILLSGPSGSGKTTTARLIIESIKEKGKKAVYLSMDDWFKTKSEYEVPQTEDGKPDFESPICVDIDLLNENLTALLNGYRVELPKYDFVGQKMYYDGTSMQIDENTIIVIEGLHALNSFITVDRSKCYRIFVKPNDILYDGVTFTNEDIRLYRRISRDKLHRGRSIEDTLNMLSSVSRGEKLYLNPTVRDIDFQVDTFISYELYLHKTILGDFQKLKDIHNIDISIKDIPHGSLLEEFYH